MNPGPDVTLIVWEEERFSSDMDVLGWTARPHVFSWHCAPSVWRLPVQPKLSFRALDENELCVPGVREFVRKDKPDRLGRWHYFPREPKPPPEPWEKVR